MPISFVKKQNVVSKMSGRMETIFLKILFFFEDSTYLIFDLLFVLLRLKQNELK